MSVRWLTYLVISLALLGCAQAENNAPAPTTEKDAPAAAADNAAAAPEATPVSTQAEPKAQTEPNPESPHNKLTADEIADGLIALFDGHSLFGWKPYSKANWEVKDDAIHVSEGEPGLLCTTVQFSDFELSVDFLAEENTNSGIFLRTPTVAGPDSLATEVYELNIAPDDNPFPTGSLVKRAKAEGVEPKAGWRTFHVTVDGPRVVVKLDSQEVVNYEDPNQLGRGYIGLQLNSGPVSFRNIKLKPLNLKPLLEGEELTEWQTVEGSKDFEAVTDSEGVLSITGGKGALESKEQYGDFVAQLQCRTNAENLNSGLFFRCIPGDMMNGYESQIHNGFKDGDRTKPVDHGTGAIFRRVQARRVVANDQEWFSKTIVADGPNISVWVNGYQVTAWTDDRQPHDNPRNGLRTQPGTLQIQGHDPTTSLSFRKIQAAESRDRAK